MLALQQETDNDLIEPRMIYGVRRRPDNDYSATVFRCPTNGRQYQSVRTPALYDDPHAPYVASSCYWCDAYGKVRGQDADFDRGTPQSHANPLLDEDDDE